MRIIIKADPDFKRKKEDWVNKSEQKLAEMQIKTRNFDEEDKQELLESTKNQLEVELDELIENWLKERAKTIFNGE